MVVLFYFAVWSSDLLVVNNRPIKQVSHFQRIWHVCSNKKLKVVCFLLFYFIFVKTPFLFSVKSFEHTALNVIALLHNCSWSHIKQAVRLWDLAVSFRSRALLNIVDICSFHLTLLLIRAHSTSLHFKKSLSSSSSLPQEDLPRVLYCNCSHNSPEHCGYFSSVL